MDDYVIRLFSIFLSLVFANSAWAAEHTVTWDYTQPVAPAVVGFKLWFITFNVFRQQNYYGTSNYDSTNSQVLAIVTHKVSSNATVSANFSWLEIK